MKYILHYTNPGDIVFDGFCGTGMTGVAAQMCGADNPALELEMTGKIDGDNWGKRFAILSDLSPAATFIASVYNSPVDVEILIRFWARSTLSISKYPFLSLIASGRINFAQKRLTIMILKS